jgi:hypothetical protein
VERSGRGIFKVFFQHLMIEMAEHSHEKPQSEQLISRMIIEVGTFKYEAGVITTQQQRFCHICCGG